MKMEVWWSGGTSEISLISLVRDNFQSKISLHTGAAPEIWIDQSEVSRQERLCQSKLKIFPSPEMLTKRDLQFPKPYQIAKSENYETYCGSKLLICRLKWVAGILHGTSLAACRVSLGRIIVVLFWTKHAVSRQIKPGIYKLTITRGQSNFSIVFGFCCLRGKRLLSCRFGRTAKLWLPLVLRAQPPYVSINCKDCKTSKTMSWKHGLN